MTRDINSWYNVVNKGEIPVITIYGDIGDSGITAKDFLKEVKDLGTDTFTLRINSPGGSVFDAISIYNQLVKLNVTVEIDSLCASAATIIAMAGKNILMPDNCLFMIHDPLLGFQVSSYMNENDISETILQLQQDANYLQKVKEQIINIYLTKVNIEREEIEQLMSATTWLSADQAFDYGFVNEVIAGIKIAANANIEKLIKRGIEIPKNFINTNTKETMKDKSFLQKLKELINSADEQDNTENLTPEEDVRVTQIESQISEIMGSLNAIDQRLTALETPAEEAPVEEAPVDVVNEEVVNLQKTVDALNLEIDALKAKGTVLNVVSDPTVTPKEKIASEVGKALLDKMTPALRKKFETKK